MRPLPARKRHRVKRDATAAAAARGLAIGASVRSFTWGNPILWLVMAVLVVGPYFRGLYFTGEQLAAALFITVLFTWRWVQKLADGDTTFVSGGLDTLIWGLAGAYLLSLLVAVEIRAAVQELIKVAACAAIYWLVQDLARDRVAVRRVLHAIVAAGTYVAVLGVAAAAGHFTLNDAIMDGRIASTLQYPNSLAAYLSVSFAVAVTLWLSAGRLGEQSWAAAAAYTSLFVIVFTYSRGGWLVFVLMAAALVLLQPAGRRLDAVLALGWTGAAFVPFGYLYSRTADAGDGAAIWSVFLGGLTVAAAGPWVIRLWRRLPPPVQGVSLGVAGASGLAGAVYVATRPDLLPQRLLQRLLDIRLDTHSAWSRLQWSRDALAMVAERPLLGGGGGAWEALYHVHQSYNYFTRHVHNHFVQLWLEVGTLGFLVWLGIWAALLVAAWRAHRAAPDATGGTLVAGSLAAALALGVHSLMDFNLALAAVALTLWAVFGCVRALEKIHTGFWDRATPRRSTGFALMPRLAAYGGGGLAAVATAGLLLGFWQGQEAVRAANRGDYPAAVRHFEQAMTFDPLEATFPVDLARIYTLREPFTSSDFAAARALMERGVGLAPYHAGLRAQYGAFLIRYGRFDEGLAALRRATELHPYASNYWEDLARGGIVVAAARLDQGADPSSVVPILDEVLAIAGKIEELRERVRSVVPEHLYRNSFAPAITPPLALDLGKAAALLGRWNDADAYFRLAAEAGGGGLPESDRKDAVLWRVAVLERLGRDADAAEAVAALGEDPDLADRLEDIRRVLGSERLRDPDLLERQ